MPAGLARVGAELRAARERLGWALPDVAAALRIRLPYLDAIEQGRIGDLPVPAYAIGYVRAYASLLGLDPQEQARRLKAVSTVVTRPTELDFPVPVPERGIPAGAVLLLALVLAVGAYVGWYRLSAEGRLPAEAVQPVPERLAPLAEQVVPPSPRLAPPAAPPPQVADASPAPASSPPMPSVPPSSAAAAIPLPPPAALPAPPVGAPAGGADDSRMVLRARADSWLQVRDRGGQVLLNRTMKTGESWPVPMKANLVMTTGNAGGTEIVVDGVVAPALGAAGVVRRDVPLDADAIKDGKLPIQLQAAASGSAPLPAAPAAPPPGQPVTQPGSTRPGNSQ